MRITTLIRRRSTALAYHRSRIGCGGARFTASGVVQFHLQMAVLNNHPNYQQALTAITASASIAKNGTTLDLAQLPQQLNRHSRAR
jgi:hypothetical protein